MGNNQPHFGTNNSLASFASAKTYASIPECVLRPLTEITGYESAFFTQVRQPLDHQVAKLDNLQNWQVARSCIEQYSNEFWAVDPVVTALSRYAKSRQTNFLSFSLADLMPEGDLVDSEYYQKFLKRFEIQKIVVLAFPCRHDPSLLNAVGLHGDSSTRSESDILEFLVGNAAFCLSMALDNIYANQLSLSLSDILSQQATNRSEGILIVDEGGRVVAKNAKILNDLQIGTVNTTEDLPAELIRLIRGARHLSVDDSVSLPFSPSCVLTITYNNDSSLSEIDYVLSSKNTQSEPRNGITQSKFGFTARESEIAALAARGHTNSEISRSLNIAKRTVENHVRAIYSKAGVNNRIKLSGYLRMPDFPSLIEIEKDL